MNNYLKKSIQNRVKFVRFLTFFGEWDIIMEQSKFYDLSGKWRDDWVLQQL